MTEPPENAIDRALFIPEVLAPSAVRTLALVAVNIPKYPARVENTAPTRKHIAVIQLPIPNPMRINTTLQKITSTLYSAFKNALDVYKRQVDNTSDFQRSSGDSAYHSPIVDWDRCRQDVYLFHG